MKRSCTRPLILLCSLLLMLGLGPSETRAVIGPEQLHEPVPSWLARIHIASSNRQAISILCNGVLIASKWVLSSRACLRDPYRVLDAFANIPDIEYLITLGSSTRFLRAVQRYAPDDGGLLLYELESATNEAPIKLNLAPVTGLFGREVEIVGRESSEMLNHEFFNPGSGRSGSCRVNGQTFFAPGVLCYVFIYPIRHSVFVGIRARLVDPEGPERPQTAQDAVVKPVTDGTRLYLNFFNPGSYTCMEDMGSPITVRNERGERELVGIVNGTGMGNGLPLCSPSLANWFTAVAGYTGWFDSLQAEARLRDLCPQRPFIHASVTAEGLGQLTWQAAAGAEGYRLFYSMDSGHEEIKAINIGAITTLSAVLASGQVYEAAIQAYNADCTSPISNRVYLNSPN